MPYLNLDLDYLEHPKTKRLIGLLGRGSEVLPIRLWCYCGKYHAKNGKLSGYLPKELEAIVGWWGKEGDVVTALIRVGFLDKDENGYFIHDWENYQGHIWALQKRNKKAAKNRWKKLSLDTQNCDSTVDTRNSSLVYQNSDFGMPLTSQPTIPTIPIKQKEPSVAAIFLAQRLAFLMRENDSNARVPDNFDKWALEADRLFEIDKRNPEEVGQVLEWCQKHNFWRSNILSMVKFRQQYPKLYLQMKGDKYANNKQSIIRNQAEIGKYANLERKI